MSITENIGSIRKDIPHQVQLICVSKYHSKEAILEAYNGGERHFGESRAQELIEKQASLPQDIQWHFIGPLQTNKVKQIIPITCLIHSVDSLKLLETIDTNAAKKGLKIAVLLEVHIADEETKHGFSPNEIRSFFARKAWLNYPNIQLCGLMTIGSNHVSESQTRNEFQLMAELFDEIKTLFAQPYFTELSMGMSQDYKLAIKAGSTMVRIGSSIFGERLS